MVTQVARHRELQPVKVAKVTDAEWLARVVLLIAARQGPSEEWAGIMWAAINRSRTTGRTIEDVVCSPVWYGGGNAGRLFVVTLRSPRGVGYRDALGRQCPGEHPLLDKALDFAWGVLTGKVRNPIGSRRYFVYPGAMSRCPCEGEWSNDRQCVNGRWLHQRFIEGFIVPPVKVGRALFV